jgi:hypothetical protein
MNEYLNGCELIEMQISALLDGEADLHEQANVVDHLLGCSACRRFYQEARDLQDLVDELPLEEREAPLIESDEALPRREPAREIRTVRGFRWRPASVLAAAAVLLLMIGFWSGGGMEGGAAPVAEVVTMPPPGSVIDVQLASNGEQMSDERFLALTLEILRSDERHQRKLYEILHLFAGENGSGSESEGGFAWDTEGGFQIERAIESDELGELDANSAETAIF